MASDPTAVLISFVLPVFNEEESLRVFHATLVQTLEAGGLPYRWEFAYVNDGSRDASGTILAELAAADPRVQVLQLSRNFGHQAAVTAGLDAVRGEAAVIMDTDLQDPPAVVLELIDRWQHGADVAYAQRRSRQDTLFKRVTAGGFYWLLGKLADIDIPRNTGDFRLIDRRVIDALARIPERDRFIRGLVAWVGFRQEAVLFDRDERYAGTSGYPLGKMIRFAGDGIMSFSMVPLRLISLVGWVIAGIAGLGILYIAVSRIVAPQSVVQGWSLTVIAILGVGGVQIIMLSVLGSYLGRIYREVQGRPLYLVAEHLNRPPEAPVRQEPTPTGAHHAITPGHPTPAP